MASSMMSSLRQLFLANPVTTTISDSYSSLAERRIKLGLSNPGTVETFDEDLSRDVFISNSMFCGLRAEFGKTMSSSPLFRVAHCLTMVEGMGPYNLMAMFGSNNIFFQGSIEASGDLIARCNYRVSQRIISKAQTQFANGQRAMQFEEEYRGDDFTLGFKAISPSLLQGGLTGVCVGQYAQSVTPRLSLGLEAVWQRPSMTVGPDTMVSYFARYKTPDWIATAQLLGAGAFTASYWRRISERVQAGTRVELSLSPSGLFSGSGIKKEGVTTAGIKYDFRMATLRTQFDSKGKLGCILEKRLQIPAILTIATDLDFTTQQARVGLGFQIESHSEGVEQGLADGTPPANPPV